MEHKFRLIKNGKIVGYERWNSLAGKWCYDTKSNGSFCIRNSFIPHDEKEQFIGLHDIYANDYCVMDCWNGGDGISEPNHHDIFEGIVVYDQKICRWGLQTKLCDKGQIEVGLEDSQFTKIEVIGTIHDPELKEKDKCVR